MGAIKRFLGDCAEAGFIPLGNDSFRRLEDLEDRLDLDWIEYMKHPYLGFNGVEYHADGIAISSAIHLQKIGVKIDEIDDFLDIWQDVIFDNCDECGCKRQWVVNKHGERFCTDCA